MAEASLVHHRGQLRFVEEATGHRFLWRRPTSREDLAWYFKTLFGYTLAPMPHPDCVAKGHVAPLDVAWGIYRARHPVTDEPMPVCIVKASRGLAGKSTMLAGVTTIEGLEGFDSILLGGSLAQSQRVHEVGEEIWSHTVEIDGVAYDSPLRHLIDDPTVTRTRFLLSGAKRTAIPAGQKSVRSPHPERLRADEIDEMKLAILESAMGQTMTEDPEGKPAQTALVSTHQYPAGTMYEMLKRATQRGWPVFEYCYKDVLIENGGWLHPSERDRKRLEVSDHMWLTEYELQEPSFEGRAFNTEAVGRTWSDAYGTVAGDENEQYEWPCCSVYVAQVQNFEEESGERWQRLPHQLRDSRAPRPCLDHRYAMGADWAQRRDWSVLEVYRTDVAPWWRVSWGRMGRRPWPQMLERFNDLRERYWGCPAAHDATGMGGNMADDFLRLDAVAVTLSGAVRDKLFQDYVVAVESGDLRGARVEYAYNEHRYCQNSDLWGHSAKDHPPDSVVAGALAWSLHERAPTAMPGGPVGPSILDGLG